MKTGDICDWEPAVYPGLTMTYSQPQGSSLQLKMKFSGGEWFYNVKCGGEKIRFPAGTVNESLNGWLGLIFSNLSGPEGAVIDTPPHTGGNTGLPACVRRLAIKVGSAFGGQGEIIVLVTEPPCMVEIDPSGGPPGQNPAYDPGGF